MARADLMSKTLIYEDSLQSCMLSSWATCELLSSVMYPGHGIREINPFLPSNGNVDSTAPSCGRRIQKHPTVQEGIWTCCVVGRSRGRGGGDQKNLYFQGSQDNWLPASPLSTQHKVPAAAPSRGSPASCTTEHKPSKTGLG